MADYYKDIGFSFKKHPLTGDLVTKSDAQAIQQSVKNLVRTRAYDRGFNVDIHTNVDELLFENYTPLLEHEIRREIETVLKNYEPRINLLNIEIYNKLNELLVTVKYRILNNDTIEQLDFILEKG